eukprot:3784398-Karenia_brevis.AAC.1
MVRRDSRRHLGNQNYHDNMQHGAKSFMDRTEEAVVGTPDGCFYARSVRRLSHEDAADALLFNAVIGL